MINVSIDQWWWLNVGALLSCSLLHRLSRQWQMDAELCGTNCLCWCLYLCSASHLIVRGSLYASVSTALWVTSSGCFITSKRAAYVDFQLWRHAVPAHIQSWVKDWPCQFIAPRRFTVWNAWKRFSNTATVSTFLALVRSYKYSMPSLSLSFLRASTAPPSSLFHFNPLYTFERLYHLDHNCCAVDSDLSFLSKRTLNNDLNPVFISAFIFTVSYSIFLIV